MNVIYKCRCMAEEATVAVPDRRDDENVVDWVQQIVGSALLLDHRTRSPDCRSNVTEYVKIPVDTGENAMIGRVTKQ